MNTLNDFISKLNPSDYIQIIGIISSLSASLVAIVISLVTIRQNSRMIEESTRPVISVYGESINPGSPEFFIVIKNFGNSSAYIKSFDYDFDFMSCYRSSNPKRDFLKDLNGAVIAPGQSRICALNYSKLTRPIEFSITYSSGVKTYHDKFKTDLKAGSAMLTTKNATADKELRTISYTLQEILQKKL